MGRTATGIRCAVLAIWVVAAPGCVVVEPIVANPVPGLSTVAIAPFTNLSQERSADPRRFAFAYAAELQKVDGFEVVPVGVVEQAIVDARLSMDSPEDAVRLAEMLGVDAVVVGSITDYDPYYPPRIGLQVQWYSPYAWNFHPGVPTEPQARHTVRQQQRYRDQQRRRERHQDEVRIQVPQPAIPTERLLEPRTVRGQSELLPDPADTASGVITVPWRVADAANRQGSVARSPDDGGCCPPGHCPNCGGGDCPPSCCRLFADRLPVVREVPPPIAPFPGPPQPRERVEPLMSYTRMFDAADGKLTASLRDYLELTGDVRSGGWEGYLHRSEDFIEFTAYLMIQEMLTMHGGRTKRRVYFTRRKFK